MIYLTILSMAVLAAYTVALCKRCCKIPQTLSQSVFYLPTGWRWLWCVVIWLSGFMIAPAIMEVSSDHTRFVAFFAVGALLFVGATPLVRDKEDLSFKVHSVAAVVCGVASQVWLMLNSSLITAVMIAAFWVLCYFRVFKISVFLAEMVCFATIYAKCIICMI